MTTKGSELQVITNAKKLAGLGLDFNSKTQIFPISHGVEYLGWRFSLSPTGRVIRRLKKHSKTRWQHRLRKLRRDFSLDRIGIDLILRLIGSYRNHMCYGNTWRLYNRTMSGFVLTRRARQAGVPQLCGIGMP